MATPGVGVLPGAGAGRAGVGYSGGVGVNLGGPVNRVGVRQGCGLMPVSERPVRQTG